MDIRIEDISSTRKQAVFNFDQQELEALENQALTLVGQQRAGSLHGFRPGKAPKELIRQRFSGEVLETLKENALRKAYQSLEERKDLVLYGIAQVDTDSFDVKAPGILKVVFDVEPQVSLPDYKTLRFEEAPIAVAPQEVEEAVQRLMRQHSSFERVERPAQKSDYVKCSYTATFEGKPAKEAFKVNPIYTHQENTWEEVDPEAPIGVPALLKALVGLKAKDTFVVTQTFSDVFEVEALRGKTFEYTGAVNEVREHKPPALDASFFKKVEADSLEDLKEQLSKNIGIRKTQQAQQDRRSQVVDFLEKSKDFPLPQLAIDNEIEGCFSEIAHKRMRNGSDEDAIEAEKETIFKEAQALSTQRIKLNFLLAAIAKAEKIDLNDMDLQRAAYHEATSRRMQMKDFVTYVKKTPGALSRLKQNTLINKTLDFLAKPAIVQGNKPN